MAREHRRLLRNTHGRGAMRLAITPLIDVVFQLLIYFLLGAGVIGAERHLRAEVPAPQQDSRGAGAFELEVEPLVIGIARAPERGAGAIAITLSSGLAQPRDSAELRRTLADALLSSERPRGLFAADHPIRIAPDRDVAWESVVEAYEAVVSAGYRSVAFGGGR